MEQTPPPKKEGQGKNTPKREWKTQPEDEQDSYMVIMLLIYAIISCIRLFIK